MESGFAALQCQATCCENDPSHDRELRLGSLTPLAYSPDLAPSEYHLFRSMEHFFREKKYVNLESIKKDVSTFIDLKTTSFYERGIQLLPEKWQMVIASEGNYFSD